ncbi:MAG TPA: hypothetical protein DCE41_23910, partial [Cytophagales bacterium]|nr:hypothetical protein [Cytophagales bacterium]HAA20149.1 hypothetical protein [Cytophagales bacterium]HAP58873.1 hypothetical protein [Cytophagales bacterium]
MNSPNPSPSSSKGNKNIRAEKEYKTKRLKRIGPYILALVGALGLILVLYRLNYNGNSTSTNEAPWYEPESDIEFRVALANFNEEGEDDFLTAWDYHLREEIDNHTVLQRKVDVLRLDESLDWEEIRKREQKYMLSVFEHYSIEQGLLIYGKKTDENYDSFIRIRRNDSLFFANKVLQSIGIQEPTRYVVNMDDPEGASEEWIKLILGICEFYLGELEQCKRRLQPLVSQIEGSVPKSRFGSAEPLYNQNSHFSLVSWNPESSSDQSKAIACIGAYFLGMLAAVDGNFPLASYFFSLSKKSSASDLKGFSKSNLLVLKKRMDEDLITDLSHIIDIPDLQGNDLGQLLKEPIPLDDRTNFDIHIDLPVVKAREPRGDHYKRYQITGGNKWYLQCFDGPYKDCECVDSLGNLSFPIVFDSLDIPYNSIIISSNSSCIGYYSGNEHQIQLTPEHAALVAQFEQSFDDKNGKKIVQRSGKWGVIDIKTLQYVVPVEYDSILKSKDGRYMIQKEGNWGLVDINTRQFIIPIEYDSIKEAGVEVYKVRENERWGLIDINSRQILIPFVYNEIQEMGFNYYKVQDNGRCGLFDIRTNQFLIPLEYNDIQEGISGRFPIQKHGKWGVYNIRSRQIMITIKYDQIQVDKYDRLQLGEAGKWGIANRYSGQIQVPIQFDYIGLGDNGRIPVKVDGKWGIFDVNNSQIVIPIEFDAIRDIKNGIVLVQTDEKWGIFYIDQKQLIVETEFDSIGDIRNGNAFLQKEGKWGVFNIEEGAWILSSEYDNIQEISYNKLTVQRNGKWGIFDINKSEVVVNIEFDDINTANNRLVNVQKNGKWGVFDIDKSEVVVDIEFDAIEVINNRLVNVQKNGKWGV